MANTLSDDLSCFNFSKKGCYPTKIFKNGNKRVHLLCKFVATFFKWLAYEKGFSLKISCNEHLDKSGFVVLLQKLLALLFHCSFFEAASSNTFIPHTQWALTFSTFFVLCPHVPLKWLMEAGRRTSYVLFCGSGPQTSKMILKGK